MALKFFHAWVLQSHLIVRSSNSTGFFDAGDPLRSHVTELSVSPHHFFWGFEGVLLCRVIPSTSMTFPPAIVVTEEPDI